MSYDLHVYCAELLTPSRMGEVIAGIEGLRTGPGNEGRAGASVVERAVRGSYEHLCTVDGPLRVEAEDLPDAVGEAAVGLTTTYELNCPFTPAVGVRLTNRLAREIAEAGKGVVYDPQEDAITWPRGGQRTFTTPKESRIDVVRLRWFVRRENRRDDLAGRVFDTIQSVLPEALPRRFGGTEPLQFRLEKEGRAGFVREWLADSLLFSWKAKPPCLGGITSGLGAPSPHPPRHPVGHVDLSFHRDALSDARWRRDVVRLFLAMIEATGAFFALSDVERNVGHSRGSLWYGPDAELPPGLVVRDEWLGLPPHEFWLAWVGPVYREWVVASLPSRLGTETVGEGLLLRTGDEPPARAAPPKPPAERPRLLRFLKRGQGDGDSRPAAAAPSAFPPDLVVQVSGSTWSGQNRTRAARVPEGL